MEEICSMRLYLLDHRNWIDDEYYDTKFIGIFSSCANATEIKNQYSSLPGFRDTISGFHIKHFDIPQKYTAIKNKMVYLLTTTKILSDGDEIIVSYRICTHILFAKLSQLKNFLAFCKKDKNKIYVSKYVIDKPEWSEGYVSME